jgi:hypothetical protein
MATAIDDAAELQEKLASSGEASIRRNPRAIPDENPTNLISTSDFYQWVSLPNGIFSATGRTQPTLPTGAYTIAINDKGLFFCRKRILTDALIDLDCSNSQRVIERIKLFWTRRDHYLSRDIIFKRGILMWGPPGSGKTATLSLLTQNLIDQGGIVLLVQHPGAAVSAIPVLRAIEPDRPLIVILEDVEEIVRSYGEHDLLALLDGEHQTQNVVNIATTNYPEMLGARIVNRPSRFDEVIKIGMPSGKMREQYLRHTLGAEAGKVFIDQWVKDTDGMSIAHLKELVVAVTCLEQPYDDVIIRLKSMKTAPRSQMFEPGAVGFGVGALEQLKTCPSAG